MGVVRERKVVQIPKSESNPESVHSGYTTQDEEETETATEASSNHRRIQRPFLSTKRLQNAFLCPISKNAGQRKTRRAINNRSLETMVEENEEIDDKVMDEYKTPFERLMETTDDGPECINAFLNKLESENKYKKTIEFLRKMRKNEEKIALNPYFQICNKIRQSIKHKKNFRFEVLQDIEKKMLDFFKSNKHIFATTPLNSFERLLFHAVAQYHGLYSTTANHDKYVEVQVTCKGGNWEPQNILLCDYLQKRTIIGFSTNL